MQRFVVPTDLLRRHPKEAVLLMRLGAHANAVLSIASMSAGTLAVRVGKQRDTLQAVLLMVSYINEAIETIDNSSCWTLIQEGLDAGYRFSKPLQEIRELFSRKRGSIYKEVLFEVRRTKGFHIDEKHFIDWLAGIQSPEVTLWRKDSSSPLEWAFTASAQVQTFFGKRIEEAHLQALQDAVFLPHLVEAMAIGLLARDRLSIRNAIREILPGAMNVEFHFKDGRPDLRKTFDVEIDQRGDFSTSINSLRDQVTEVFGGNRVGAIVPGKDCDIHFSSKSGYARGFLASPSGSSQ